ncbi:hypothetical protein GCM10025734_26620 [Kitasatospora paranensis]
MSVQKERASQPFTVTLWPVRTAVGTPEPDSFAARFSENPAAVLPTYRSPSFAVTFRSTNQVPASSLKTCLRFGSTVTVPRQVDACAEVAVHRIGPTFSTP